MNWREEWKPLAVIVTAFLLCFYLPVGTQRFDNATLEAFHLVKWYAQEQVLLCLIPTFFIAGAISVFVSQGAVMKYLGAKAEKVLVYGVAAVSGIILAVYSCTVLPLFAGIYRMGAGLGPACALRLKMESVGRNSCFVCIRAQFSHSLRLLALLLAISTTAMAEDIDCGNVIPSETGLVLSLESAVQMALANNPEIAAATWEVEAAHEKLSGAKAAHWPILSVEALYQRNLDDQRLIAARFNGEPGVFDDDISKADVVLKIPVYSGGKVTSEIKASALLHLAETKRLARTREELVFNVSSTFFAVLGQQAVIRAVEQSIDAMEGHLKKIKALEAVRKAAPVDVMRTEVRLAELRQSLIREKNSLAVGKRLLANLMGAREMTWSVSGELALPSPLPNNLESEIAAAMETRLDYLAAKDRLEAQAYKVDTVKAGKLPMVSLLASYGGRMAGTTETEDAGAVGIALSVPIFDGGRVDALVRQEKAVLAAARERLAKLELQIRQDVETALLNCEASDRQLEVAMQSVGLAKEVLRIERLKYEMGKGTALDVLDAQSSLLQACTSVVRAMVDSNISRARLALAQGGPIK